MDTNIRFEFTAPGYTTDDIQVMEYNGRESICRPYMYELTLKSTHKDLDLNNISEGCTFKTIIGESEQQVNGILFEFEELQQTVDFALYKVKLVPQLWRLGLFKTNEVYLELDVEKTIIQVLEEGGLIDGQDFECKLSSTYRNWPFRVQYQETHLDFIHRIIEREGIYYFFDQTGDKEKIIFTDSSTDHVSMDLPDVRFQQMAGMDSSQYASTVFSFLSKQKQVPAKVVVKDYNEESPLVDIKAEVTVDDTSWGEVFIYGDNVESTDEALQLAEVRAEEILCRKRVFHGESYVNRLQTGYLFDLNEHFRTPFNTSYLVTEIEHQGTAPGFQTEVSSENSRQHVYQNTFTAIDSNIQYRAERIVQKQRIHGTMNAHIDSEGDGTYAELDEFGRYRVTLPFDRVVRDEGKASYWLRQSQPYAGEGQGMHFPLLKGTEVLLTFIDGDPDRPVINGAVPNASQPSVVNDESQTNSRIKTASGNMIEIEDQEGKNRIKLQTPEQSTYLHLGAANHPGTGYVMVTNGIYREEVLGGKQTTVTTSSWLGANSSIKTTTAEASAADTSAATSDVIDEISIFAFKKNGTGAAFTRDTELAGTDIFDRRLGDTYTYTDGNTFTYGGSYDYGVGNGWEESHAAESTMPSDPSNPAISSLETTAQGKFGTTVAAIADSSLVERVFSTQWAYSKGSSYEVVEGNSFSYVSGNTKEWIMGNTDTETTGNNTEKHTGNITTTVIGNLSDDITGNVTENVKGDVKSIIDGDTHDEITGDLYEKISGRANIIYMGVAADTFLGFTKATYVGGLVETKVGVTAETFLGLSQETFLGAKSEVRIGPANEAFSSPASEVGTAKVTAAATEIGNAASYIKNTPSRIYNSLSTVTTSASTVNTGATTVTTNVTTVMP